MFWESSLFASLAVDPSRPQDHSNSRRVMSSQISIPDVAYAAQAQLAHMRKDICRGLKGNGGPFVARMK